MEHLSIANIVLQTFMLGLCIAAIWVRYIAPRIIHRRIMKIEPPKAIEEPDPPAEVRYAAEPIDHAVIAPLVTDSFYAPAQDVTDDPEPDEEDIDEDDEEEASESDEEVIEGAEGDNEDGEEDEEEDDDDEPDEETFPVRFAAPIPAARPRPTYLVAEPTVQPLPRVSQDLTRWITWIMQFWRSAFHLLVIGQTGAGKTTALQVFVEQLVNEGIPVVVCDPDAAAGDWPGTELHGSGDDFEGINRALIALLAEVKRRREARAEGLRTFPELWVVLDEYADIKDECKVANGAVENALRRWRKLNIHMVIGVGDAQVKTLGFERKSALLNHVRIVTLRLTTEGKRYAKVDDQPAVMIPNLSPVQGTAAAAPTHVQPTGFDDIEDDTDDSSPIGELSDDDKDEAILKLVTTPGWSYAKISQRLKVSTTRIAKVKREAALDL